MSRILLLFLAFLLLAPAASSSQRRSLRLQAEAVIQLPEHPVDPRDCTVQQGSRLLQPGIDYRLDAMTGQVHLLAPSYLGRELSISYSTLLIDLPAELYLQRREQLPWIQSSDEGDSLVLAGLPDRVEELPSQLQYTGSFLRGVRVGNNGELGMESGLQLEVQGQLGPEVEVEAFLSDRNTPIQPEGSTRNLEEIDRIHVQVSSPRWRALLGDFDLDLHPGTYLDYRRTVDGVQAGYEDGERRLLAHLASARGRFHRMEFNGLEGVQGPWQLLSEQGSDQILVLAGTERVWMNGEPLSRGEEADYVIDYGLGQLRFTARRPVRAEDRIQAEYQYSERLYQRNLYGVDAVTPLPGGFVLETAWVLERDDPDRPLDAFLDDEDREILGQSGDGDGTEILGSGVREVEPGEGAYRLIDAAAGSWGHYEFAEDPVDSLAGEYIWDLRFSRLAESDGSVRGDYSRQFTSSGRSYYRFEGPGLGEYAPVMELVAPTSSELLDARLSWAGRGFRFMLEPALSRRDANLLSAKDDGDNAGAALRSALGWESPQLGRSWWGGKVGLDLQLQNEQEEFRSMHAVDEQEFERLHGLSRSGKLARQDATVRWSGGDSLRIQQSATWIKRELEQSHSRESRLAWAPELGLRFRGRLRERNWSGAEDATSRFSLRELGPGLRWRSGLLALNRDEERLEQSVGGAGNGWVETGARLEQDLVPGLRGRVAQSRRRLDKRTESSWKERARREEWRSGFVWNGPVQGELDWTHRVLDFASVDSARQRRDIALLHLQSSGEQLQWSLRYQAEHSLSRERVLQFLEVDSLQGDYSRDPFQPELFVPDPDGDYIAIPYETGDVSQEALIDLAADMRWQGAMGLAGSHRVRIEERSRLERAQDLFLLKPSALQGDSSSQARIFSQQDLEWRESASSRRWRLRWEEERDLSRPRWSTARRSRTQRFALRLRAQAGEWRLGGESRLRRQLRELPGSTEGRLQIRAGEQTIEASRELAPGWLLRGNAEAELAGTEDGAWDGRRLELEPALEARPGRKGSFSLRASWQQVWSGQDTIPYELLGGARVGRTLRAGLDAHRQLGRQTRLSLFWQMTSLPERSVLHTARIQVQSFF